MPRRARAYTVEATTLAAVVHRWQASRAWPSSASRPHGTQHDSPRCHLCSCCGDTHPPTARASRGRQQHAQACTCVHGRSRHPCCRGPPMVQRFPRACPGPCPPRRPNVPRVAERPAARHVRLNGSMHTVMVSAALVSECKCDKPFAHSRYIELNAAGGARGPTASMDAT